MHILRRILPTFGVILITFGATLLIPEAISFIGQDGSSNDF